MDFGTVVQIAIGAALVWTLVKSARGLASAVRRSQRRRQLDRAGLSARAQVVEVEPLQQQVNQAAGHPVRLRFTDPQGHEREVRDTSGLGGYAVREGDQVMVRTSPSTADLFRVEQIHRPAAVYPVPRARTSTGHAALTLATALLLAVGFGFVLTQPDRYLDAIPELIPIVFVLIGAGGFAAGLGQVVRQLRHRGAAREEVAGEVTEVWSQWRQGSSRGSSGYQVYPFTVRFSTRDGRRVHTRYHTASSWFRPKVGEPVRVRYVREHPVRFQVLEQRRSAPVASALLAALPPLIGAVFAVLGVVWLVNNPWT